MDLALEEPVAEDAEMQRGKAVAMVLGLALAFALGILSIALSSTASEGVGQVTRHLRAYWVDESQHGRAGIDMEALARRDQKPSPPGVMAMESQLGAATSFIETLSPNEKPDESDDSKESVDHKEETPSVHGEEPRV